MIQNGQYYFSIVNNLYIHIFYIKITEINASLSDKITIQNTNIYSFESRISTILLRLLTQKTIFNKCKTIVVIHSYKIT